MGGEQAAPLLDIRVGTVTKCWEHPEAEKLYCEEIDIGEEAGPRTIASGLRPFYASAAFASARFTFDAQRGVITHAAA